MWWKLLLGFIGLAVLYAPTFTRMAHQWWHDTYAVHGMFVPLFAAHFLWTDRKRLRNAVGTGDSRGLVLAAAGLGALAAGHFFSSLLLLGWSFVLVLAGLLLFLFGKKWMRVAAFPLAFLFLMVPLPHSFVDGVTTHLQRFAASFAGGVLQIAGVPSYQKDVFIYLPGITLEIAEVCNGLRFLMALLVLTVAFSELLLPSFARKATLVASVFPVAILANATRVAVVAFAAHYWGPEAASGPIHHGIGKVVWVLTLVPMGAILYGLRRFGAEGSSKPLVGEASPELRAGTKHA